MKSMFTVSSAVNTVSRTHLSILYIYLILNKETAHYLKVSQTLHIGLMNIRTTT